MHNDYKCKDKKAQLVSMQVQEGTIIIHGGTIIINYP